jgi:hypothetical protein
MVETVHFGSLARALATRQQYVPLIREQFGDGIPQENWELADRGSESKIMPDSRSHLMSQHMTAHRIQDLSSLRYLHPKNQ